MDVSILIIKICVYKISAIFNFYVKICLANERNKQMVEGFGGQINLLLRILPILGGYTTTAVCLLRKVLWMNLEWVTVKFHDAICRNLCRCISSCQCGDAIC